MGSPVSMKVKLEYGAAYQALVACSKFEKLLVNHGAMIRQLEGSGFRNVAFRSVQGGFRIQARYFGPTGDATLPGRVRQLMRLK
jgi:hypothetical protein